MAPPTQPSHLDRWLAAVCRNCPVCRQARRKGAGIAFSIVRSVESKTCPFCRAYRRVYGRPAYERPEGSPPPPSE